MRRRPQEREVYSSVQYREIDKAVLNPGMNKAWLVYLGKEKLIGQVHQYSTSYWGYRIRAPREEGVEPKHRPYAISSDDYLTRRRAVLALIEAQAFSI